MPSPVLTRRALIAGAGTTIASAALAIPYVNAARSDNVCSLPLDPQARFDAAAAEFKAAAEALRPGITDWKINVTDTAVLAFASRPFAFAGPGVYEVEMRDISGSVVRPIVALAASEAGGGYYWQTYWLHRNKLVGEVNYAEASKLTIISKIKSLA